MTFNIIIVSRIDYSVKNHTKKTYYTSSYFVSKTSYFYIFDLASDFSTLKMTLEQQNNTINGFFRKKSHEKEVLHIFLALFIENGNFAYLILK